MLWPHILLIFSVYFCPIHTHKRAHAHSMLDAQKVFTLPTSDSNCSLWIEDKAMRRTSTATTGDYIVDYDIYNIWAGASPFNQHINGHLLGSDFFLLIYAFHKACHLWLWHTVILPWNLQFCSHSHTRTHKYWCESWITKWTYLSSLLIFVVATEITTEDDDGPLSIVCVRALATGCNL